MADEPNNVIPIAPQPLYPKQYLGDAVYVEFDGYQIWLTTADGNNQQIALEPAVFLELLKYAKQFWRFHDAG